MEMATGWRGVLNAVDAGCSASLSLTGRYCGDGAKNDASGLCDDGNTTTETACPYGTASCQTCNSSCTAVPNLTGPYCGDGAVNGSVVCDDNNADACGTCDATCKKVQLAQATGAITVNAIPFDASMLVINDGNNMVVFEFDKGGSTTSGRVVIDISSASTTAQVASAINTTIFGQTPFGITATVFGSVVGLTNKRFGSFGNRAMTATAGSKLMLMGMSGGAGYDCAAGVRCSRNENCEPSLICLVNHTCGVP